MARNSRILKLRNPQMGRKDPHTHTNLPPGLTRGTVRAHAGELPAEGIWKRRGRL